jgi:glyoxylase-like metal-dependent hydrolase (beta-lactamase superfamily II)
MSDAAKTREVADGVVQLFLPLPVRPTIVNVYLVRAGDAWTLIDTGMNTGDSSTAFRGALAEVGIAPQAIRQIVCTHHHIDHYGSSGPLRELTHAQVYLHPLEAERAAGAHDALGENPEFLRQNGIPAVPPEKQMPPMSRVVGTLYSPAIPDGLLADGDEIPLGDGRWLHAVWTPGHTPGHCCLLLEPDGVFFVGDHLLPKITPHVGISPGGPPNPLGDFLASQDKIARVEARLVCPAHGGIFEDHRRRASQLIDFHRVRKLTMLEIIRKRPCTAYEVALEAFAISPDNRFQVMAATSETLAHLELLRLEGRALRSETDGVVRYRAK